MKSIERFIESELGENEPNELESIKKLRPQGPRVIWQNFDDEIYIKKLSGALHARFAGCILGAIVEFWPITKMKIWAMISGDKFPPLDYWKKAKSPKKLHYSISPSSAFTREGMDGVPVDDDIIYTLLGLLIVEEYGNNFTVDDVGKAWLKYLPYACTAEEIAIKNLKRGIAANDVGALDNPYDQWIGAAIRSDPFAYMAPGLPEKAASMAYHDAFISHRKNGIYGEMFFSASQAAAFTVNNSMDALKIGLTEIPKDCAFAKEIRWALDFAPNIKDYKHARKTVDERYKGMSRVHVINNAVLTVFGLKLGGNDVTRVLSELVAMGLDNDCTAATAGSIVGAIVGIDGVPKNWYRKFNNKIHSYLNGIKLFQIDDVLLRFTKQARKTFNEI